MINVVVGIYNAVSMVKLIVYIEYKNGTLHSLLCDVVVMFFVTFRFGSCRRKRGSSGMVDHPLQNSAAMQLGVIGRDGCSDAVGPHKSKESHADAAAIASEPSWMHTCTAKWTNVQNYRILAWRSPPNGDRRCPSHLSHHCRSNVRGTTIYSISDSQFAGSHRGRKRLSREATRRTVLA